MKRFSELHREELLKKSQQCLWTTEGEPGLAYLRDQRKISDSVIKAFRLGYVPSDNRHQLAGRVIIPLYDASGHLVVLSSRLVIQTKHNLAKYWHESYKKNFFLYGVDQAKPFMRKWGCVVLCISGEQECIDPVAGLYKKIQDFNAGDYILSFDTSTKSNICSKIRRKVYSGDKMCYRVSTSLNDVILTGDHRVFANGKWVEAKSLKEGDCLLSPLAYNVPTFLQKKDITAEECRLLGYFIGDGYCCGSPCFTNMNTDIVDDFISIIDKMGDRVDKRDNRHYMVYGTRGRGGYKQIIGQSCSNIQIFLKKYGIYGKRAYEKTIPSDAFIWEDALIINLLNGLYDTDGHIGKSNIITYSTTSYILARQLQILLLRFKVVSKLKVINYKSPNHRTGYLVTSTGLSAVNLAKTLKLQHQRKESRRISIISRGSSYTKYYPVAQYIRSLCGQSIKSVLAEAQVRFERKNKKYISLNHISRINKVLQDGFLSILEEGNVYVTTVTNVEKEGVKPVYDLEVNGTHNFYCENMLLHNCEGQFDVLQLHNVGICNTIGLCSTNLSDIQMSIIRRYCNNVIVILDNDENRAGQDGAEGILERNSDHVGSVKFVTVELESGFDPDEFVKQRGGAILKKMIKAKLITIR
ncbi:hypothetical protein LCGC14_0834620, partial [marine sediment metagenome]